MLPDHTTKCKGLDQMVEGLKLFDVISLLQQHPLKFKSLFVFDPVDSVLTVDQVVALFDVVLLHSRIQQACVRGSDLNALG